MERGARSGRNRRAIIIQGSPRRNGNTDRACRYVAERIRASIDTTVVDLFDLRIERCRGCRECMRLLDCVIRDDFTELWREIGRCDIIVQGAPVYWYAPPGIMKDFIDRTHATYALKRGLEHVRAYLITVAADSGFENTETVMSSWITAYGGKIEGRARIIARETGDLERRAENLRSLDRIVEAVLGTHVEQG